MTKRYYFSRQPRYLPTREEIELACAEIRATWSPYERRSRMAMPVNHWSMPQQVHVCLCDDPMDED